MASKKANKRARKAEKRLAAFKVKAYTIGVAAVLFGLYAIGNAEENRLAGASQGSTTTTTSIVVQNEADRLRQSIEEDTEAIAKERELEALRLQAKQANDNRHDIENNGI